MVIVGSWKFLNDHVQIQCTWTISLFLLQVCTYGSIADQGVQFTKEFYATVIPNQNLGLVLVKKHSDSRISR